jgi:predicted amidohydrolase YtcJ
MRSIDWSADLVLRDTRIHTVDDADRVAQAIAVRDGRIVAVGGYDDVEPWVGRRTRVESLPDATVVPGFIDAHTHNVHLGEFRYSYKQINAAAELNPTLPDLFAKVRERTATVRPGEWIGARNYNPNQMRERRWPTRHELDAVAPGHAVMITIRGGHACVMNTPALEAVGIGPDTPDPPGGVIERDAGGDRTGVLRDMTPHFRHRLPQSTLAELKEGLRWGNDRFLEIGITSVCDAGATPRPESYQAYREAVDEGLWRIRTYLMVYADFLLGHDLGLRTGFGDDRLRLGAVKLFTDGSIQCYTCAFHEPYLGRESRGHEGLIYTQEEADALVTEAHRRGWQVAIHAQGDYGIEVAVNAIEHAMRAHPRRDPRHRIEHALCPTRGDLGRMHRLGIVPNFYVFHPWFWGDQHVHEFLGRERAERMVPVKSAMAMGMPACAHSDCPVCTPNDPVWPSNPLWGMACAATRRTRGGEDIGPHERLTAAEALRMYTRNGAYSSFDEARKGSLEVGKLGDMVVLGADPLALGDPWDIRDIEVEKTIIGGEVLYERG